MAKIQISTFQGIAPRIDARLLSESQGQVAENLRLTSLALQSWRQAVTVDTPAKDTPAFETIYLYKGVNPEIWLAWDTPVHVVKSPIADDDTDRIYWTGDGKPKAADNQDNTTTGIQTTGGNNEYPEYSVSLGIPAPATAPTVAVGATLGAGTTPVATVYVYTFVSQWGEESAPSPASAIVSFDHSDGDCDLSALETSYAAEYNPIDKVRIYRSLSGTNQAAYQLVAELDPPAATYTDNTPDTGLGEIIESTEYDLPPADMFGLLDFGNGILVGFTEDEILFCEPYQPHAWPNEYRLSVQQTIVGGGVFGNTLVVCTEDQPVLIVGNHPSTMTMTVHPDHQACLSAQGIVQMRGAVIWPSPNGLYQIGYGGSKLLTEPLYDRETWQQRNPSQLRATHWDTRYIGFTDDAGLVVETANGIVAASDFNIDVDAIYADPQNDELYISQSMSGVNEILGFNIGGVRIPYKWRSKKVSIGSLATLTAGKILAKYGEIFTESEVAALAVLAAEVEAANAVIVAAGDANGELNGMALNVHDVNGSEIESIPEVPVVQNVVLTLFADGEEVGSAAANSDKPFRLPSGYRARQFEIQIESFTDVNQITLASSISDLLD